MPALNVLSNLFTTVYNNESRRKRECIVVPASKFASEVLRVMQKHRYIGEFEQIDDGRAGKFRIQLLAKINKCGILRLGKTVPARIHHGHTSCIHQQRDHVSP
jgi:small subunit ribosomal protein S8